jgi:two-component system CheB/CheR fusion protein
MANAMFYKTFHLHEEHTEGRLLYDLNQRNWDIPKLRVLLEEELPLNPYIYGYELSHNFPGIGEKVLLINARRIVQKIHGEQLILLALEDITEHRRAQQMIAGRETWFRNLADNAPVMIWVTDKEKQSTFFNKAWLEFRGDSLEEGIRKGWMDGVHPDDVSKTLKMFDDNFAEKLPFELKYRVLHHGTNYVWLHNKAKPNFSPEGQFLGYIGSCVVIDEIAKEKNG